MKNSTVFRPSSSSRRSRLKLSHLLSCGAVAIGLWTSSSQATNYYWDDTPTTDGTSATPTGTWGTDAFFNTSATGSSTGTFITSPALTDLVQFVARASATDATSGSGVYTVTVNGTQNALGLVFRQTGTITLGGATAGSGTINLGASGIDNSARSVVTGSNTAGGVIINANLVLQADQSWVTNNVTSTTPPFTIAGNTTGTTGANGLTLTNSSNRPFTVTGGLNYTGALTVNGGNGNGSVSISGNTAATGSIGSTVTNLTVNTSATNLTLLSRAGGNSYGGTTTITAGKLVISNTTGSSATGTSAIALNGGSANATLAGTGFSTGLLTVTAGSRLAPGSVANSTNFGSVGTLTVGTTTLTSANLDMDLATTAAGTSDRLVTGALTLGSTVVFNLTATALQTGTPYTLITAANTTGFNSANITTNFLGGAAGNYTAAYTDDGTNLQVTFASAVPEPSTWAGVFLALVAVGWSQRKRFSGRRASTTC